MGPFVFMNSVAKNDRFRSTAGSSRVDINVLLHFRNSSSLSKFPNHHIAILFLTEIFLRVILKKKTSIITVPLQKAFRERRLNTL